MKAEDSQKIELSKTKNHLIVLLLIFLFIIVVLLIAIIIVMNYGKGGVSDVEEIGDCSEYLGIDEIAECAGEMIENSDNYEGGLEIYQNAIDRLMAENNQQDAVFLINDRSTQVAIMGNCELALKYYDELNYDDFSDDEKSVLYSYAASNSIDCANEEAQAKWTELLSKYENGIGDQ